MKKILVVALIILLPVVANAMDYMSGDDIKKQFNNKTFDGHFLPKDKKFRVFSSADGNLIVKRPNGQDPKRSWFVNDKGQRCVTHPKWKSHKKWKNGRCANVVDAGNGEILMYDFNGKHTHTFTNFREGNQL